MQSLTPNSRPRAALEVSPEANRSLISSTRSHVSFDFGLYSPSCLGNLPALIVSCVLSQCDPEKRWAGFTHALLWQICRTTPPTGMVPPEIRNETLCALLIFPQHQNSPYPPSPSGSPAIPAVHSWHPPGLIFERSTFLSKLRWFFGVNPGSVFSAVCILVVCEVLAGHSFAASGFRAWCYIA